MSFNQFQAYKNYKSNKLSSLGQGYNVPNINQNIERIQTDARGRMKRSGMPVTSQYNLQKENEMAANRAFIESATPLYLSKEREKDILRDEIAKLGVQSDKFEYEEKQKRDAEKDSKNKLWTKLGFTALGALAAIPTGGLSLASGLAIGSGVGDVAAGMGVGTGYFMEEDQIDEGLIAEGLFNTVGTVANEIKLTKPKAMTSLLADNVQGIMKMDDEQLSLFSDKLKLLTSAGEYDAVTELINSTFREKEQILDQFPAYPAGQN